MVDYVKRACTAACGRRVLKAGVMRPGARVDVLEIIEGGDGGGNEVEIGESRRGDEGGWVSGGVGRSGGGGARRRR